MQHNIAVTAPDPWRGFGGEGWRMATDVAGFIRDNVTRTRTVRNS